MKEKNPKVIGLDVGTSRIVMARPNKEEFAFASQLNAFVSVPHSKMTEGCLRREGIQFSIQNNEIVVVGNDSPHFADLLRTETRRPMTEGVLNPSEPEGVPVIRRIIEGMVFEEGK